MTTRCTGPEKSCGGLSAHMPCRAGVGFPPGRCDSVPGRITEQQSEVKRDVRRQDAGLQGMWQGICIHRRRAGVLRRKGLCERAPALPGLPPGPQKRRPSPAGDVHRSVRRLRQRGAGALPAPGGPPCLLQRMFCPDEGRAGLKRPFSTKAERPAPAAGRSFLSFLYCGAAKRVL